MAFTQNPFAIAQKNRFLRTNFVPHTFPLTTLTVSTSNILHEC